MATASSTTTGAAAAAGAGAAGAINGGLISQADVLDQIFAGLRSKNHETRVASAVELQRYVRTFSSPILPVLLLLLLLACSRGRMTNGGLVLGVEYSACDGVGCSDQVVGRHDQQKVV